jgi:flagellar protein FliT
MNTTLDRMSRLGAYELVAEDSRDLLAAARAGDAEAVERARARCRAHVEALRRHPGPVPLRGPEARRRRELLAAVLADDREIRDILEPAQGRIAKLLGLLPERGGGVR